MGGLLLGAFKGAFAGVYGLVFNIAGTITGALLGAAVALFNWVSSESFISLSYTQLDNPFIEIGWTLTRDLTNIFFVLALVAIGLGTALRLTGYQAKKALPTLIIIALLINFTPVILGLIVDAANIVMNFFIQGGFAGGNSFVNYATSQWSNIGPLVGGFKFWDPLATDKALTAAVGSFILIWFNLIAALVYLLFALIFILRYVAIWTLVILSPFAFASYILPATRFIWSQWWKAFIQWSLIGVIAAFFLYLGDHFIRIATSGEFLASSMSEISGAPGLAPIMNSILPYFVALAFLFIGLIMSLTFAPAGASGIIKAGQRGFKASGAVLRTRAVGAAKAPWRAIRKEGRRMAKTYRAGRSLDLPAHRAIGETMKRGWEKRWKPAMRPAAVRRATKRRTWAATKGTWSAIKDSAKAGWGAALGKKKKRKGEKCPVCKAVLPIDADFCPKCGLKF